MARLGRYRRAEVLVGLFSLLGIVVLVFGMLWLREFRFTRRYNVYQSVFPNTGGLLVGDPIMVSGLRKGKVRAMELLDNGVRAEIAIEQDVRLRSDAHATIVTRGILGERYVEIDRGQSDITLPPGSELPSRIQVGVSELMASTGELVESARAVSADVQKIVQALSRAVDDEKLQGGLQDATAVVHDLRGTLAATRPDIETSVRNFRVASESLARMTSGSEESVVETTARMRSTLAQLDTLLNQLSVVAEKTDRVAGKLLEEESTFGKVVNDRELYDHLLSAAMRADSLISDIKENPKKFIHFSLF